MRPGGGRSMSFSILALDIPEWAAEMTGLGTIQVTETGLVGKTTEAKKGFMYRLGVVRRMCQHFAFGE